MKICLFLRVMKEVCIAVSLLMCFPVSSATVIDPLSFEQIWLINNQRNLIKRYHYFNRQVQSSGDAVYLIGIDAASDKVIETSDGRKDALLSRMNIHYQSKQYLFLIDWFSAIPQPQTTEGFYYGDLVAAYTWQYEGNNSYLTLGLRQKSAPRTVIVNSQLVFNATDDASDQDNSVFIHYNYQGYDFGSYYSDENKLDALSFYMPLAEFDDQKLSSTLYYFGDQGENAFGERYELSLDHLLIYNSHNFSSGAIVTYLKSTDETYLSNVFTNYTSPANKSIRYVLGAY